MEPEIEFVFIRCGHLPPNGRSKNYRTNEFEAGISVFEGIVRNGEVYLIIPTANETLCENLMDCVTRPAYIVQGDVVGQGSDGEPVLANVEIVKKIQLFGQNFIHDCDKRAEPKPVREHIVAKNYFEIGSNEYVIGCKCGFECKGPDKYDVQAAFDFHWVRNNKG